MKNNPITIAMIAISIIVFSISSGGASLDPVQFLTFNETAIMHGQVWRLFTPMFLHFGSMHILFNSYAIWILGNMVEGSHSRSHYITMSLVMSGVSNLAQDLMVGPQFGGLSGLLYGLFGYIWICGWRVPETTYRLDKTSIYTMLGWYLLCWTGLLGNVANWAHTGGLVTGMVWAYLATLKQTTRSYPNPVDNFDL